MLSGIDLRKEFLQLAAHLEGVFLLFVRPAASLLSEQMKVCGLQPAPHHLPRAAACQVAPRPKRFVQVDECAALDKLCAEVFILGIRSVHPVDPRRSWQSSAIFSTQRIRCLLVVNTRVETCTLFVPAAAAMCSLPPTSSVAPEGIGKLSQCCRFCLGRPITGSARMLYR